MGISDIFRNLIIDTWYKAIVYLAGVISVISLFVPVKIKGVTNTQILLISAGIFFIGIGEWKFHKVAAYIKRPSAYTGPAALIQYPVRKVDLVGIIFYIIGSFLIILGICRIIKGI